MNLNDIHILRQALPYINKFHNKLMVVKIGGEVADNHETLVNFCEQVALCARVGIEMVVVHGGGKQVSELSKKLGIQPQMINGRRITDADSLEIAKMVFAGKISTDVVTLLRSSGLKAVGLSGIDGNLIHAKKRPPVSMGNETVDFGFVGDIVDVEPQIIDTLISGGFTPVIASLASDNDGITYNINADTVASAIATAVKAEKLILVSNVEGVLDDKAKVVSKLNRTLANELIQKKVISGGMLPKVEAAFKAIDSGVKSVHFISGLAHDTLLTELFTESGCGTMIS